MTAGLARLLRLQTAFAAQKKMLECRLLRLQGSRRLRESAVIEIGQALASPVIAALPLFVSSVRRLGQLEDEITQIDRDIAVVRGELIESHARSALSGETARHRAAEWQGAREASALIEMVAALGRSSLPQDGRD